MFEEIISALENMGISFEEMPEQGMLSVEVTEMDKMQLIELLNMVYSMNMTVSTLNESTMTISSGAPLEAAPEIEPVAEEDTEEDAQTTALDDMMSGL